MSAAWEPEEFGVAFPLALLACVCWGSWSNTAKAAAKTPFPYYIMDFTVAIFVTCWFAFLVIGGRNFFNGLSDIVEYEGREVRVLSAVGAGLMFNIANVLLVIGIQAAGLSIAFPIGIGTALVLGTLLTKIIDPTGDNAYLFSGVALAFLAVCANALASREMEAHQAVGEAQGLTQSFDKCNESSEHSDPAENQALEKQALLSNNEVADETNQTMSGRQKIVLLVVAGILMSIWSPANAYAIGGDDDDGMTTYGAAAVFSSAVVVSTIPILFTLSYVGLVESVSWKLYFMGDKESFGGDQRWGFPGGIVWAIGFLCNSLAGNALGFALSYSIGQSAPMVATLWGLLYYNEFKNAPRRSLLYVGCMFLLYIGAVTTIALG